MIKLLKHLIKPREDLVTHYKTLYNGIIREPDEEWVNSKVNYISKCLANKNMFAEHSVPMAMNSYQTHKTTNSKITYVLWKFKSGCEVLKRAQYCANHDCSSCIVRQKANEQLKAIELGQDVPSGK